MQIHLQNEQNKDKNQDEKNQIVVKKSSILKKKKIPFTKITSNINPKYIINIGDICFLNEDSLRNPQQSQETLLKALFHYKMISKVTMNNSFVIVNLKKNQDNIIPPEYFFQRLRSFGDRQMANIANHLETIHKQFSVIKASHNEKFIHERENQKIMMNNFFKQMEGKKYFVYFSSIFPDRITMNSIAFSVPLLKSLGCNIKNLALDFLKYKHIFFEVFTAKNYGNFMQKCLQNFALAQQKNIQNQINEQTIVEFLFQDQVIKRRQQQSGIYQQIQKARVRWFSPHPSICCFQILDIDQKSSIRSNKKRKINEFIETKPEDELNALLKIGFNSPNLIIQKQKCNQQSNKIKEKYEENQNNQIINRIDLKMSSNGET